MNQNIITESGKPFTPINNLAKWVVWIFIVLMILYIIAVISGYAQAELLNRAISGRVVTQFEALANDEREALIAYLQIALIIASGIVFLRWIHRAHKNLPSLRVVGLRFTPGWAVGWFFVPIMSLFRPYQVVSEIWKASDPGADLTDAASWQNAATSSIVGWWWALFLISNYLSQFAARLLLRGETLSELLTSTYVYMASDAIDVVGIIVTILMVRRISQLQETKNKLIISLEQRSLAYNTNN